MTSNLAHEAKSKRKTRDQLIWSQVYKISEILDPIIPTHSTVALIDFPNHRNVGDSAIWLGERNYLRNRKAYIAYMCDHETYSRDRLAAARDAETILLSGGGNFGDLYGMHQQLRERIVEDFPGRRIVQLPQTIYFRDRKNLDKSRRIFERHPNFTMLVRDTKSLELVRKEFQNRVQLCPDMAFYLRTLQGSGGPSIDCIWLARNDSESALQALPPLKDGYLRRDWLEAGPTTLRWAIQFLSHELARYPKELAKLSALISWKLDAIATQRLQRGIEVLSEGRFVITDRLHGHIFCLLMNLPHIILDNNYHKVKNYYETWTQDCELVQWANNPSEAMLKAEAWLDSHPSQ